MTGIWTTMYVDREYIGAYLDRGELGVEAYDAKDKLIDDDVFSDTVAAHKAVFDCWEWEDWSKDGASTMEPPPQVDRSQIETFVLTLFKHATPGNWVSLRMFFEDRPDLKPKIASIKLNGNFSALIDQAYRVAELAAHDHEKLVFCPPIATFINRKHAREKDLAEGPVLTTECDKAAAAALAKLEAILGPPTLVVASGGAWISETGEVEPKLHIHYRLKAPAKSNAEHAMLKETRRLTAMLVGADTSSVSIVHPIRWPGSLHRKKEPRLCHIVTCNPDVEIDLALALEQLRKAALAEGLGTSRKGNGAKAPKTAIPDDLVIADAFKHIDPTAALADGIELREIPPLPFPPIKAECPWLRQAFETGGEDHDQSQWHLMVLAMTFVENGHTLAHQCSDKHVDYGRGEKTEAMWDRKVRERKELNLGWPSCAAIEGAGSTHCAACPHRGGKSPLKFGFDAIIKDRVDEETKQLGGAQSPDLRLPEGFCLNKDGIICAIIPAKRTGKNTVQPARLLRLINNQIGPPSLQFQNGHFGIGFTASTDRSGRVEIFLTTAECYPATGLVKCLAEKGVMTNTDKAALPLIHQFAADWITKLQGEDEAVRDSGTLGWRYQDDEIVGFAYGNMLYHKDGRKIPLTRATDDVFYRHYLPAGRAEAWIEAARLLTARRRPELDIIIAIGFAAPLMVFTGTLYGAILSIWGPPGTAKSTAQQVAAAIWGHPKQTRESLNSTPKSVQGRLGRTRNLPAYWDDIQDERHQDALFQTMFVATQGTEGGRLNMDATMKERLDWQTLLVACSNASFVEYLVKKQKSTTAGMRRVFEIEYEASKILEPGIISAIDAGKIFAELERNFGRIGAEYAGLLVTKHKAIDLMVAKITKKFMAEVNGAADENYWWGMCGVLIAGATLANRLGAEIDVPAMRAFLVKAYRRNREIRGVEGTEGGSAANTEQWLANFLNHHAGNRLWIDKLFVNRHSGVTVRHSPQYERSIYVQIVRDQRLIIVSKHAMREFFKKHEVQAKGIFDGLKKYFGAGEEKITLGAGTYCSQVQESCFVIPVRDDQPLLYGILTAWGAPEA